MNAARRLVAAPGPMLRVFNPEADDTAHMTPGHVYAPPPAPAEQFAHTTVSRVRSGENRRKSRSAQPDLPGTIDPAAYAMAEALARQFEDRSMSPDEAAAHAVESTLAVYWRDVMKGEKKRTRNTLGNYDNALSLWERYAPTLDQPGWKGWPLGVINSGAIDQFLQAAVEATSTENVRSRWKHLRAILNHAADNGVIPRAPKPGPIPMSNKKTAIFTDEQIAAAYQALRTKPALQVAFVLAINTGMRPVDLFLLRRDAITWSGRQSVTFTARKTGKVQTLPLAEITVRQLARLNSLPVAPYMQDWLFGSLTDVDAKDPERSRTARDRNQEFKDLLAGAGIKVAKPWQVCRATCNERLESIREGAGQFMLGHGTTLNSKSYREPSQLIYEAVNSVSQPFCFCSF